MPVDESVPERPTVSGTLHLSNGAGGLDLHIVALPPEQARRLIAAAAEAIAPLPGYVVITCPEGEPERVARGIPGLLRRG